MHASMVLLQSLSGTAHQAQWKAETLAATAKAVIATTTDIEAADTDLDDLARDQISALVSGRLKGHGLTRLAEGILKAQGYATYRSPEGADGGAYILAGSGPLGFSVTCPEIFGPEII